MNSNNHKEEEKGIVKTIELERLRVVAPLGRGAKGAVFLVREDDKEELLALKVILRELVEKKNSNKNDVVWGNYRRISFEREVLGRLNHPLLPRLRGVLSTEKVVGYAMDYCSGRDLNYLRKLQSEKMFLSEVIRFYAAELVLALEYLHDQGIAYRDLKPENILIQQSGHMMLVDFDLSTRLPLKAQHSTTIISSKPKPIPRKHPALFHCLKGQGVSPEDQWFTHTPHHKPDLVGKSNSFVGTEEYVAPEIIEGHGHDFAVDWWSLGIVLYEMLYGVTPFKGSNRKETFLRILTKNPDLVGEPTPLRDLIKKLLIKDPKERIKLNEIRGHEFFSGVNWNSVIDITRPPYIPPIVNIDESGNNNKEIDVELFVQGIFGTKQDEKNNACEVEDENRTKDGTNNRGVSKSKALWVSGLSNQPYGTEDFLVF